MAHTYVDGYHIPMPRIIPCEWVECGCPGWHVLPAGHAGDLLVGVPLLFYISQSKRLPRWLVRLADKCDEYVRDYTQAMLADLPYPWWWRFVPQAWVVNGLCNGGGELTQLLANYIEPEFSGIKVDWHWVK